jgi:hypothetical protein
VDVQTSIAQALSVVTAKLAAAKANLQDNLQVPLGMALNGINIAHWVLDYYGADGIEMAKGLLDQAESPLRVAINNAAAVIAYDFAPIYNALEQAAANIAGMVGTWLATAAGGISDWVSSKIDGLHDFIGHAFDVVISAVESKFNETVQEIGMSISNIVSYINGKLDDIVGKLLPAINSVKDAVVGIVEAIPGSLVKMLSDLLFEEAPAE